MARSGEFAFDLRALITQVGQSELGASAQVSSPMAGAALTGAESCGTAPTSASAAVTGRELSAK